MIEMDKDDEIIVKARGLIKRFGDMTAVDGIDLDIRRGEIFGFLGPNGAGKTTTMKIVTTLIPPTSGTVEVCGHILTGLSNPVKEKIGIIQQHIALDRDVTVRENIRYHAILHRIPRKETDRRIEELSEIMGLGPYLDRFVIDLSGGWKRRVAIVCAIIHRPEILFLDEPTAGLDTQSRHTLWKLIRDLNRKGTTIFLTTHYMDEAEELCDRVAIIDHGKTIAMGTPQELCDTIGRWAVEYDWNGGDTSFRFFSDWEDTKTFANSLPHGTTCSTRKTNLEDVFLELTGRDTAVTEEVKFRV